MSKPIKFRDLPVGAYFRFALGSATDEYKPSALLNVKASAGTYSAPTVPTVRVNVYKHLRVFPDTEIRTLNGFIAPESLDVLTGNVPGFIALCPTKWERENRVPVHSQSTLWRPANVLKGDTTGMFVSIHEGNFQGTSCYQVIYKVKGYKYLVTCWFDKDGARIA